MRVLSSGLHYFFGITRPSLVNVGWASITLLNCILMIILGLRLRSRFGLYMLGMAVAAMLQGSHRWGLASECLLAVLTGLWVWTIASRGRLFAWSAALMVVAVLVYEPPAAWSDYPRSWFYVRLYSTATFLSVVAVGLIYRILDGDSIDLSEVLSIPWFAAVLLVTTQTLSYWESAYVSNLTWTACLLLWTYLGRRSSRQIESMRAIRSF